MTVETQKSSSSEADFSQTPQTSAHAVEQIEHHYTRCPNCKAQVILLPRTIKTFCYLCGEPVTRLDSANMYYEEF
jgi:rRNA maturation endonuclease Nob1